MNRIRPAEYVPDLSPFILAAAHPPRLGRGEWIRYSLATVALTELVLALPALVLAEEPGTTAHLARHIGALTAAIALGFLYSAWRPQRAYGVLPIAAALSATMLVSSVLDISRGVTPLISEAHHVLELAGFALVWMLPAVRGCTDSDASAVGREPTTTRRMPLMRSPEGCGGRRSRLLLAVLAGLIGVLVGPAAVASAHAELLNSSPAAGSVLSSSPDRVTLTFNERVEVSLGAIRLLDGSGRDVAIGIAQHPSDNDAAVTVALPHLADGSYVVDWQVISADSHQVHAAYTFQVGAKTTLQSGVIEQAIASSGTGRAAGGVLDVSRGLVAAGFAVVIGSLVMLSAGLVEMTKRLRRTVLVSAVVAAAAGIVAIPLEAGYAANRPLSVLADGSAWSAVMRTQIGRDWLLRALLIGVGTFALVATIRWCKTAGWRASGVVLAVATALTFSFGGHGDSGRWQAVGVVLTAVHVVAMGIWLGGLVALMLSLSNIAEHRVRQFSRIALACVAVIVVTGSIQSVRQLGTISALTSTRYGQLLIWKLVAVALVLFVASMSRRLVYGTLVGGAMIQPLPAGAAVARLDRDTLRRSVTLEVIFGVVILAITSSLMAANPSAAGNFKPYSASLTQSGYIASISLDPARVGSNQLHVYLSSVTRSLDNPDNVTVQLTDPSRDVAPIQLTVTAAGAAHYVAVAELPYAANWTLTITARYHTFDQVIFTTIVRIRA